MSSNDESMARLERTVKRQTGIIVVTAVLCAGFLLAVIALS